MGITDSLKASGFVPEKSSEGEFKPLDGIYKVSFVTARKTKSQKDQTDQLQCEFKVVEVLEGDQSYSKFNEFRKYLALEGEKVADKKSGIPFIINALFTAGKEVDQSSDEALMQSITDALGTELYFRAWGWTPEDGDKAYQQFSVLKETVALKKAKKSAQPF